MSDDSVRFTAPLLMWHTEKHGGIGYVLIDGVTAEAVTGHELMRRLELGRRRGFGSVRVTVRVGASEWRTSAFPQAGGGWFLPVKKAIQRAENISEGEPVEVELELH